MTAGIETEANFAADYYRNGLSEGTEPSTLDAWSFSRKEACVAPPSNAQLVYADNTEFSVP